MERPADDLIRRLLALKPRPGPGTRKASPAYTPTLSKEQWDAVFDAVARGVKMVDIFEQLPKPPAKTFKTLKSFYNAYYNERKAREREANSQ